MNTDGYFTDLSALSVGGHTFRLRDCIEVNGHDDSLPYTATLYIGNKKVCNVYNDGYGGETQIIEVFNQPLLDKAQKDVNGLRWVTYPWERDMTLMEKLPYGTLSQNPVMDIADYIAETYVWFKSFTKKRNINKVIIAINESQEIKTITLHVSKNDKPDDWVKRSEAHCKSLIKNGWFILNAPHLNIGRR